jgi:hypothetical protein
MEPPNGFSESSSNFTWFDIRRLVKAIYLINVKEARHFEIIA